MLAARTRLGLTQPAFAVALASQLGKPVDRTQVAKWETGVYTPRPQVVMAAARLAGLTLRELIAEGAQFDHRAPRSGSRSRRALSVDHPREQLKALLEFGFSLPEAIELVRTHAS
ncbi:MAG TPA: helix-turn-helix transcriptional regulator [Candidatus Dormibacteraeota bacterium]